MNDAELIPLVDALEDAAEGYLTLEQLESAANQDLSGAITRGVLLVDHRTRVDNTPVILCRLNRHHPQVIELTSW